MSSSLYLRDFIRERLTSAAEEIFTEFEKSITQYEERIRLLDTCWRPQIKLHRIDLPQQHVCTEDEVSAEAEQRMCNQETNYSLTREKPGPLQIKQEVEEEFCSSQEEEEPELKEETNIYTLNPSYEEDLQQHVYMDGEALTDQLFCDQESNSSHDQVEPEAPLVKEEEEEFCSFQEEERRGPPETAELQLLKMDALAVPADRQKGWYLSLMAPNTKGPEFAWLDPSRLYCNSQALADCVKDLLSRFHSDPIDLVAGIDAMGFILGASVATTLGKGFLAIRKAGHLCVATQTQNYTDYTGREKTMEVRLDVLKPGVRVLLVDQWIETGGTMRAAIQLVEKLGATVVGVAAVAIENTEGGKWIKENYKFSHCIPEALQSQVDGKYLNFFKSFNK